MKRAIVFGLGLSLMALLAAFVGGQWLNAQASIPPLLPVIGANGKVQGGIDIEVIPSKELPAAPADATGKFTRRTDNSVFICNTRKGLEVGGDKAVTAHEVCDGPEIEVVVGHETLLYHDLTSKTLHSSIPASRTAQQALEAATIADLDVNQHMWVWGERRGDRITARVILVEN
jgi:hypothetical protein